MARTGVIADISHICQFPWRRLGCCLSDSRCLSNIHETETGSLGLEASLKDRVYLRVVRHSGKPLVAGFHTTPFVYTQAFVSPCQAMEGVDQSLFFCLAPCLRANPQAFQFGYPTASPPRLDNVYQLPAIVPTFVGVFPLWKDTQV